MPAVRSSWDLSFVAEPEDNPNQTRHPPNCLFKGVIPQGRFHADADYPSPLQSLEGDAYIMEEGALPPYQYTVLS